jgi:putative oxidoreductase
MLKSWLKTDDDRVIALLRIVIGIVMFTHGAGKVLGWYGGPGIGGAYGFLNGMMHVPGLLAYLVIYGEFFGSIGLIVGFLGRLSALGIIAIQIGALILVHQHNGWFDSQGYAMEYSSMALAMLTAVLIRGSGAFSIDLRLTSK